MILGLFTKQEAKAESKIRRDIQADPTLQKVYGVIDIIKDYQQNRMKAGLSSVINDFVNMNVIVPTSCKAFLESPPFQYTVTSVSVPAPNIPNLPYVTTWIRITRVSWE